MSVYKEKSPCFGCVERSVKCHSTCEKYKAWKATGVEPKQPTFYQAKRFAKTGNSAQRKPK